MAVQLPDRVPVYPLNVHACWLIVNRWYLRFSLADADLQIIFVFISIYIKKGEPRWLYQQIPVLLLHFSSVVDPDPHVCVDDLK